MPLITLPPRPQLNSIKNKMALAYMHGLNATINYTFNEPNREVDNMGIDLIIWSFPVGQDRSVASDGNQINIQLKSVSASSSTMLSESEEFIQYNLSKDLCEIGTTYLVVVVLPKHDQILTWREVTDSQLLMNARAYYLKVNGRIQRGRVTIPKSNVLNPESYKRLFQQSVEDLI